MTSRDGRWRYAVCGAVLDVNRPIPEAASVLTRRPATLTLDVGCPPAQMPAPVPPGVVSLPAPPVRAVVSRAGSDWTLFFSPGIWLALDGADGAARAGLVPGVDEHSVDWAVAAHRWLAPAVFAATDGGLHVSLHAAAAAVAPGGPAFIVTGQSGAGKTAVTRALCAAGFRWAGDEFVRLRRSASGWRLTPGWPIASEKRGAGPTRYRTVPDASRVRAPVAVVALYRLLDRIRPPEVRIRRVEGSAEVRCRRAARGFGRLSRPEEGAPADVRPGAGRWETAGPTAFTVERPLDCPPEATADAIGLHVRGLAGRRARSRGHGRCP